MTIDQILFLVAAVVVFFILRAISVRKVGRGSGKMMEQPRVMHSVSSENADEYLRELIKENRLIEAIKLVRLKTGMGLKEAKDYVEELKAGKNVSPLSERDQTTSEEKENFKKEVVRLAASGHKIEAIKVLRHATGIGLKEAKDYVENLKY